MYKQIPIMTRKGEAVGCTGGPRDPGRARPRPFSGVTEISGAVNSPVTSAGTSARVSVTERLRVIRVHTWARKIIGGFPVAEEQKQPEPAPKDERALIIEDLKARMDKIESDYQIKIGDYQKANAELWARLHPAQQEPAPPAQPEPVKDPYEVMLDSFDSALGIKKKKE